MLCQFTFENFKSFKNEAFLDLCAEPISDNLDSLIIDNQDDEKFLPVISIYGPNGSGKSTVMEALDFLRELIVRPDAASDINGDISFEKKQILRKSLREPKKEKYYKFDKLCENRPIRFEIMFRFKGIEYQYEISVLRNNIVKENLYYKEIGERNVNIAFERTEEECIVGEIVEFVPVEKIKNTLPLLSHIASSYDVKIISNAMSWFYSINFLDYDNSYIDKQVVIPAESKKRKIFFEMLRNMDINISDLRIEEDANGNIKEIFTKHIVEKTEFEIPIEEESSGTRKVFSFLARINDCLADGTLLVADELDAKLHPKLLRYIIGLFTDPNSNKNGAQLLITSHDMVNMNPEVFRRDELWFCALNQNNESKLYSLISFKEENGKPARKDAIYGKRYLEGKYGADPYIRKGLDWGSGL